MKDPDYIAPHLPNLHMEGDHDPHANYRVNPTSYLAIDGDTGKYSIAYNPPKIPQGFTITPHKSFYGLRQFMVTKPDADAVAYHIVNVGTMMVQNGYAYVAGTTIYGECPPISRCYVYFPPFAFKFSYKLPAGVTQEEHYEQLRKEHEDELRKIIESDEWTDLTQPRILDFRLTSLYLQQHSIYPTCSACGAETLDRFCPDCGSECLQVENVDHEMDLEVDLDCGRYRSTEMQLGSDFERLQVDNVDRGMYLDCRGDQSIELQLGNAISGCIVQEIKAEIKIMKAEKEAEYKDISEAIKALKLEIQGIYTADTTIKSELETARAEALMEVGRMAEEVLKSNRKAAHVAEQLKAAQAAHATTMSELETARAAEREALMEVGRMAEEVLKSNREAAHVAEQLKAAQTAHATTMS